MEFLQYLGVSSRQSFFLAGCDSDSFQTPEFSKITIRMLQGHVIDHCPVRNNTRPISSQNPAEPRKTSDEDRRIEEESFTILQW